MFEDFRLAFLREMVSSGIDSDVSRTVMGTVDRLGTKFEVSRKVTALVPIELTSTRIIMEYLACKSLEGLSKQTIYNYQTILLCFIRTVRKPMEEIEPNDIRLYLYQYQQKRKVSNRTLDKIRATISGFFHWAALERRIQNDPCACITAIKFTVKPRSALNQLELEYIRRACGSIREKAIIELLYSTGCRVSELCGIKKCDVNWQNRTVEVFGKGSKYRTCYINAKAYVTIMDYLNSRIDDDEYLNVSERKPYGGLTRYSIEKIVRDISQRAYRMTGKHVTPHIFRHTTATTALQNGMPVQNVSRMLGHEQIETTMIYAELNNNDVQRDHTRYVV